MWIYHDLFIRLPVGGHLGRCQFFFAMADIAKRLFLRFHESSNISLLLSTTKNVPGSPGIFPVLPVESVLSPRSRGFFLWGMVLETNIRMQVIFIFWTAYGCVFLFFNLKIFYKACFRVCLQQKCCSGYFVYRIARNENFLTKCPVSSIFLHNESI